MMAQTGTWEYRSIGGTGAPQTPALLLPSFRGGFTLLEVVVSVAVTSVILLGVGSAMLIAGRAIPQAQGATTMTIAAAGAAEQMATELQYATAISQRSTTMIEFSVPDRSGDGIAETIRYEWSGTTGAPLIRQYNGGTGVPVLADIREFALAYDVETISQEIPQSNESAETCLVGYYSISDLGDYSIRDTERYGEYFFPVLPADALSWKVTRVRFYARRAGVTDGTTKVQLQLATALGLPSGVVLQEKTLYESTLPALLGVYQLCEATYTQVSGLSPQQGLCLVSQWQAGDQACELWVRDENVTATNLWLTQTTDQGQSWSSLSGQSLLFWVYGTVTTTGTPEIQNTYYLNAVRIQLRAGNDSQATVQTAARTVNRPEVVE